MKTRFYLMFVLALAAGIAAPCPAATPLPDFEHYQVILERKPFGEVVPPEGPAPGDAASGTFSKDLELRAIVEDGETMRVGMFDKRDSRSFYIAQGETVDQIELVSVDYDAEEAVLRKLEETIVFKLRPDQPAGEAAAAAPAPGNPPAMPSSPFQTAATDTPGSQAPRRPFFAELKRRRAAAGTNQPAAPRGFAEFFKQTAQPGSGASTNPPAPFGPFTPVSGTNAGFAPFATPPNPPPAAGDQGFLPFNPNQPGLPADSSGEAIENFIQLPAENPAQPADAVPFQFIQ